MAEQRHPRSIFLEALDYLQALWPLDPWVIKEWIRDFDDALERYVTDRLIEREHEKILVRTAHETKRFETPDA